MQDMPLYTFISLLGKILTVGAISYSQSYHLMREKLIKPNHGQSALKSEGLPSMSSWSERVVFLKFSV